VYDGVLEIVAFKLHLELLDLEIELTHDAFLPEHDRPVTSNG
jgi:hypothetical protein